MKQHILFRGAVYRLAAEADDALTPEALAQMFHETYERLAPEYNYETRKESAKPWEDVPADNKALMIATCDEIMRQIRGRELLPTEDEKRLAVETATRVGMHLKASPSTMDPATGEKLSRHVMNSLMLARQDSTPKKAAHDAAVIAGRHAKRLGLSFEQVRRWLQTAYGKIWVKGGGLKPELDLKEVAKIISKEMS